MAKLFPLLVLVVINTAQLQAQETRFIGTTRIAGDQLDAESESIGGIGSGLAYDATAELLLAVSDRGPGDGTIDYRPRFETFKLTRGGDPSAKLKLSLTQTTLFRTREGAAMSGLSPELTGSGPPRLNDGRRCIDPEAIALAPDGTLYVADEYGPFLYQFKRDGTLLRRIEPPANYRPRTTQGEIVTGTQKTIVAGRVPNHGFEGLALSPDGKIANLILQSGLIQDGGKAARLTRILCIEVATGKAVAEYVYRLEDAEEINLGKRFTKGDRVKQDDLGISELTAINDHQFLVLERDNHGANGAANPKIAKYKCIYLIELNGATNLLALAGQPYAQLPGTNRYRPLTLEGGIQPVQKTLVLNFAQSLPDVKPDRLAAKWEGIALTPPDASGQRTMWIACDNDFLNPVLQIAGKKIPFSRAQKIVDTTFLEFAIKLP